jgi:hypothetical protein
MKRWLKVLAIVGALAVLLAIVMLLLTGGQDGGGHRPRFDHGAVEAA